MIGREGLVSKLCDDYEGQQPVHWSFACRINRKVMSARPNIEDLHRTNRNWERSAYFTDAVISVRRTCKVLQTSGRSARHRSRVCSDPESRQREEAQYLVYFVEAFDMEIYCEVKELCGNQQESSGPCQFMTQLLYGRGKVCDWNRRVRDVHVGLLYCIQN
mgnify:CR=1 FL=1